MSGVLGAGKVYLNRKFDDGTSTGFKFAGNCTSFTITESSTIKERTSKMADSYGQVLDSVAIKSAPKIAMTFDEMDKTNMAMVHLGTDAVSNQAAVANGTKTFAAADIEAGVYYELGAMDVTVSSVKTASNASFSNFEVDALGGLIMFNEEPGEDLTVSFTAPALTGFAINGSVEPTIKTEVLLVGKNLSDGSRLRVSVAEAVLTPKNGLDYLSSDYASAQYEGTLNTPTGMTSPYTVSLKAA